LFTSLKVGFALDQAIYHTGPIQVYMSKASGDVKSYDGSGDWFKISSVPADITASAISWADEGQASYTFDIPSSTRESFISTTFSIQSFSLLTARQKLLANTFFALSTLPYMLHLPPEGLSFTSHVLKSR
jgi:hypothetical protein